MTPSRQFPNWLAEQGVSLAFTTYQAGKLFLIGLNADGRLSIFERTFNRCMGLWTDSQTIWMSSLYQIWRMENVLPAGETYRGHDRLFVPQVGYTTGDIDVHDMAVDRDGRLVFAATLFGCLATLSESHSFKPLWKPPFLSKLAAEDRCHLNGLAMRDGRPRYVTAVSRSDVADGWRDRRTDGGVVVDVDSGEIVADGLSMPHSPRWHDDRLWLSNAGTGEFGYIDPKSGRFEPVTFCPGFLRGATIVGDFAVVGLSLPRENQAFTGLALDEKLKGADAEARCALYVIDLKSGDVVHWLRIEGVVQELYDVAALPGVRRPMAIGFMTDEIRRVLTVDDSDWPDRIENKGEKD
ncbi:MAG: TIGR03032 family protein [Rhizobiales bacterium NRL2]|nr:MAG: TIGR03032 family protein [Rhizobiales bacterium NRL2]